MEELQYKAQVLSEALPYIKKFNGKIFVIKYGGHAMVDDDLKKSVIEDIALLKYVGINPIIIHGGGPEITKEMNKEQIKPVFVDGLRYTDEKTMEIVAKVSNKINTEIISLLKEMGCEAVDCTRNLILTKIKDEKLGLVGEITGINYRLLLEKLNRSFIPVISPIGFNEQTSQMNNVNADTVAAMVAEAVNAHKLTILTDVEGVRIKGKLVRNIDLHAVKEGIANGSINLGMIPKLLSCVHSVHNGVNKAHLINGTIKHSLLLEIFTDKGIGTEIVKNGEQKIKTYVK